ncbi:MAG: hypothetical protein LBT27_09520 [Prevotellaceae bacterium]|jgi:uncharacterized membrane protein HdeD (DUF308 family)|nr:hypothetical protein [Prevotellaceae bacterium]
MEKIDKIIENKTALLQKLTKNKNIISLLRGLVFIIIAVFFLIFFLWNKDYYYLGGGLITIVVFIYLIFLSSILREKIEFNLNFIEICQQIQNKNKSIKNAIDDKIIDIKNHPYCLDLDILGKSSLFEKIDISQTIIGNNQLKQFLLNPLTKKEAILKRQDAIKELSTKLEWNINILTLAKDIVINANTEDSFIKTDKNLLANKKTIKTILPALPIINGILILCSVLFFSSAIISLVLGFMIIIYTIIHIIYGKDINNIYVSNDLKSLQYKQFAKIFQQTKNENFKSDINKENQMILFKALPSIEKMSILLRNFEKGYIPIFGGLLNIVLSWNLYHAIKLEKLQVKLQNDVPIWFKTFAEVEAFICFGIFAYKYNKYTYPIIDSGVAGGMKIKNLSHPLILQKNIVENNFSTHINDITIITGANMTGKSTFLRAIGVNLVLAMNGCPVAANYFRFYPMNLFTSMRTFDSLADDSSYFNAEIKKLKFLMEQLENNIPQYIILDEILKGTNSYDKLMGSKLFLEKIIKINTPFSCLIATHDLELTKIEKEYPENIENYCFELQSGNPDYKLKKGITKTMNAIRLLKEYKIID